MGRNLNPHPAHSFHGLGISLLPVARYLAKQLKGGTILDYSLRALSPTRQKVVLVRVSVMNTITKSSTWWEESLFQLTPLRSHSVTEGSQGRTLWEATNPKSTVLALAKNPVSLECGRSAHKTVRSCD